MKGDYYRYLAEVASDEDRKGKFYAAAGNVYNIYIFAIKWQTTLLTILSH